MNYKSLILLAALALPWGGLRAQLPEADCTYTIEQNASGLMISVKSTEQAAYVTIQEPDAEGYEQEFTLVDPPSGAAAQGFNVMTESGLYWYRDGYNFRASSTADLAKADAIYTFEEADGYILIKNAGTGKYIASDKTTAGSKLYSDKTRNTERGRFLFTEAGTGEVNYTSLNKAIAEAEALLASTADEVGDEAGQFPASAYAALSAAVAKAKLALASTDAAEVRAAAKELKEAIAVYRNARNPKIFAEGIFTFTRYSDGLLLCSGYHANKWEASNVEKCALILGAAETSGYNYSFIVRRAPEGAKAAGYNIYDLNGGALRNEGGKLLWNENPDPKAADYIFTFEDGHDDTYKIVSAGSRGIVGPNDNGEGWSWQHLSTTYTGATDNALFYVDPTEEDVKARLEAMIADAESRYAQAVEGTDPGQFPAEARAALSAAIATAKGALGGSEFELADALIALKGAIDAFKAARIPNTFGGIYIFHQAVSPSIYLCSGYHANSWEKDKIRPTALYLNKTEIGSYNYRFYVTKTAEGAQADGYNIADMEGHYLYDNNGALEWSEATVNPNAKTAIFFFDENDDQIGLRNANTGLFVGPNDGTKGWSWIHAGTKDKGVSGGHWFVVELLGQSFSDILNAAIAKAEAMLANTAEGTEPGQYPREARANLSAAIADAKAALDGSDDQMSQATADLESALAEYLRHKTMQHYSGIYTLRQAIRPDMYLCSGHHANSWEASKVQKCALYLLENDKGDYNYRFSIAPVNPALDLEGFNICDLDGNYLYNADGKLLWEEANDPNSIAATFRIEENEENDYVVLRSVDTDLFVGPDDNGKGWSWQHAGTKHIGGYDAQYFILTKVGSDFSDILKGTIEAAEELLDAASEGTGPGQYPSDAIANLRAAIAKAKEALGGTDEQMKNANADLKVEMDLFLHSRVPLNYSGHYRFAHYCLHGAYLSNGFHANSWEAQNVVNCGLLLTKEEAGDAYNQDYDIRPVDGFNKGVNIYTLDGTAKLVNNKGALMVDAADEVADTNPDAVFSIDEDGKYVIITNLGSNGTVGPNDNTGGWTWIHLGTTHSGAANGNRFIAEDGSASGLANVTASDLAIYFSANALTVSADARVEVYTLAGIAVAARPLAAGESLTLPAGAYIVRATTPSATASTIVLIK